MTSERNHLNDHPAAPAQEFAQDQPPSYEQSIDNSKGSYTGVSGPPGKDAKNPYGEIPPNFPEPQPASGSGTDTPLRTPSMPARPIYNYVNPNTGEHIVSVLPPDHPEMVCLQQGEHVTVTHYGWIGILAAIVWFPWGIGCCLMDRKVRCKRCGRLLEAGMCG
ncbi:hypothetical protein OBBRIDRAFT_802688 [Obba rivulosa]|uniref:Brain protein I3 n=1 Tax=Obba rivulosa TaxID=1052685 RepID=A0A8E2DL95_9APHY|nr:hypothetical protein OBBRIDRAFT_802688 [Obba rivulosa]